MTCCRLPSSSRSPKGVPTTGTRDTLAASASRSGLTSAILAPRFFGLVASPEADALADPASCRCLILFSRATPFIDSIDGPRMSAAWASVVWFCTVMDSWLRPSDLRRGRARALRCSRGWPGGGPGGGAISGDLDPGGPGSRGPLPEARRPVRMPSLRSVDDSKSPSDTTDLPSSDLGLACGVEPTLERRLR